MLERSVRVTTAARASPSVMAGSTGERLLQRIGVAGDGEPAQLDAEEEDEQESEKEVGHADAEESKRGADAVDRGVAPGGRQDPRGSGDDQRDSHGEGGELEARPDALAHVLDHGLAVADRAAEIA